MLKDFVDYLQLDKRTTRNNIINAEYGLKKIQAGAGRELDDLTYEDIQNTLRTFTIGDTTKETIRRRLIQYFNWKANMDPDNNKWVRLVVKINSLKPDKNKIKKRKEISPLDLVSPEEVKRLINVATLERDRAIVAVLFEGGLRVGELISLKTSMVVMDDKDKKVTIYIPAEEGNKTGARTVSCLGIYPHVRDWLKCNTSERFIPITGRAVRNVLISLYARAGIKKRCNPHILRYSSITYMASLGASSVDLSMRFWGIPHSAMADVYIKLSQQQQEASYKRLMRGEEAAKADRSPLNDLCVSCGAPIVSGSLCKPCADNETLKQKIAEMAKEQKEQGEFIMRMMKEKGLI